MRCGCQCNSIIVCMHFFRINKVYACVRAHRDHGGVGGGDIWHTALLA